MSGGAFGSGGFGSLPFGAASGVCVLGARQTARNAVDVTFAAPMRAFDPSLISDALRVANWTLEVREPATAVPRLPQFVEDQSPTVIRVFFDGPLTAAAVYRITVADTVEDMTGIPVDPLCSSSDFETFGLFVVRTATPTLEQRTDLANPQTGEGTQGLATYQVTDAGDFALDRGRESLKKRILRRATTAIGGFFHLPGYGFREGEKSRLTVDLLRRMQARAQAQVRREPDVVSAVVRVSRVPAAPSVVFLSIRVVDVNGNTIDASSELDLEV